MSELPERRIAPQSFQELTNGIPLIALTGFASPSNRDEALRAGFSAHLAKPVDQPLLVRAIDTALSATD
jgi:CheY-like chemotaxis protein